MFENVDIVFLKNLIDYGVILILALMSVVVVWFASERFLFFSAIKIEDYTHKKRLEIDLSKRLTTIATIGSNAPYIGLLGTVLAIMLTFFSIGENGVDSTSSMMAGLALALKATAAGLLVAIPSVMIYNYLVRKMEIKLMEWEVLNEED